MPRETVVINQPDGLHARPAAQFVKLAAGYKSSVKVHLDGREANAKSILSVLALGASKGARVELDVEGDDAEQALRELSTFLAGSDSDSEQLHGIAASPGVVVGSAFVLHSVESEPLVEAAGGSPDEELVRWRTARERVIATLTALAGETHGQVGPAEAAIFQAQVEMANDPDLEERVRAALAQGRSAEYATKQASTAYAARLAELDDPYLRARADDVREVGHGLLQALAGNEPFATPQPPPGVILCARELAAGVLVRLDPSTLAGLALGSGGATSHVAIVARTLGLPAVVGLGDFLPRMNDGIVVGLDADTGNLYVNPRGSDLERLRSRAEHHAVEQREFARRAAEPAITPDGAHLELWANIGGPGDIAAALAAGATGVGLLRTEFLIAGRETLPSEDEQYVSYRQIIEGMGNQPVVVRTFDIGGDKPVPALGLPLEANPFLGYRAVRIGLDRPELLRTQMRAIVRAGEGHSVWIMLPMVATLDEVRQARALLNEIPESADIPLGVMVEIPSAALIAPVLAREVDFFSLGTNDLTQYTLAVDRTDERLASLYQPLHPAVLRLIQMTAAAAVSAKIPCGVCGELAGDPRATAVLMGLGVTELSMSAGALGYVKREVCRTPIAAARKLAGEVLAMSTTAEVLARVEAFRQTQASESILTAAG